MTNDSFKRSARRLLDYEAMLTAGRSVLRQSSFLCVLGMPGALLLTLGCSAGLVEMAPRGVQGTLAGPDDDAEVLSQEQASAPEIASWQEQGAPPACPGGCLADLDPSNDHVIAPPDPIDECRARLERAGIDFLPAALPLTRAQGTRHACGAPQAVVYRSGPERISYSVSPVVSCGMALALARLEVVMNEEAVKRLGEKVVRIDQVGTYNCRLTSGHLGVSEHSYANAIDIRSLTLDSGRQLSVAQVFGQIDERDSQPEGPFLRHVSRRLFDEGVFSNVLTPFYDRQHRDHLHLDLARYRIDGTRP